MKVIEPWTFGLLIVVFISTYFIFQFGDVYIRKINIGELDITIFTFLCLFYTLAVTAVGVLFANVSK